uniref:Uncharacterized protein n=1 Tax=viral metagenome TaxID=1070528 RepID=A0A6M3J7V2_9ZZZZ
MPAVSKNQKTLACIALSMANGETSKSYSKQAAKMAESMSKEELATYCKEPVKK